MRYKMVELPTEAVPTDVRLRAEGAAMIAARMLELPRPTVRYHAVMPCPDGADEGEATTKADALLAEFGRAMGVEDAEEPEVWYDDVPQLGLTRRREPGVIHLMAFAEPFDLVKTALHEVRHQAQYATFDLWKALPPSSWEWDSDQFAEDNYLRVAAQMEVAYQRGVAKLAAREANRYRWIRGYRTVGY